MDPLKLYTCQSCNGRQQMKIVVLKPKFALMWLLHNCLKLLEHVVTLTIIVISRIGVFFRDSTEFRYTDVNDNYL